jgi:hypothetical protein
MQTVDIFSKNTVSIEDVFSTEKLSTLITLITHYFSTSFKCKKLHNNEEVYLNNPTTSYY